MLPVDGLISLIWENAVQTSHPCLQGGGRCLRERLTTEQIRAGRLAGWPVGRESRGGAAAARVALLAFLSVQA